MKYSITIEGGFTGIPTSYKGEVHVGVEEADRLMALLPNPSEDKNTLLRDVFQYRIELEDGGQVAIGRYDDSNLPPAMRLFLDRVREKEERH